MRYTKKSSPAEFWSAAGPAGCWEWQGARDKDGYGQTRSPNGRVKAHRRAWEIVAGSIPEGLYVLHRCNNPSCVRPDHLYLGTALDNGIDRRSRSRKRSDRWTLSRADVESIRTRYSTGTIRQRELGEQYGVGQALISRIVLGKSYRFDVPIGSNARRRS